MDRDLVLLFATRTLRMAAYGGLAVVLALYLAAIGLDPTSVGLLLTATLAGDAIVSLWLAIHADRDGRRRTLMVGALLMVLGGVVFALTDQFAILIAAAVVAVLSPSGNEVGPFLSVEQAALSEIVPSARRTTILAWYQLVGSLATAAGSLIAGLVVQMLLDGGAEPAVAYRTVIVAYAVAGIGIGLLASRVSNRVESPAPADPSIARRFGLHRSQRVVAKLSALFALDAFGGGFVIQTVVALWFATRWGLEPAALGAIFFGANALAGLSGLVAARLAARFGLIATMVGTHIPSNVLLILVPFMPTVELAVGLLLVRFSISQMDVPTRQSYTISVVDPDERSAAAGLTGVARSAGAAISPLLATPLVAAPILSGGLPFVISGTLKIAYDLLLWREFRSVRPPEESPAPIERISPPGSGSSPDSDRPAEPAEGGSTGR
jgi:MFS family permease